MQLTEEEVLNIGFEKDLEYPHDQFITKRYQKYDNQLEVELTYENNELVSSDITIEQNALPINAEQLKKLTEAFKEIMGS